MDSASITFGTVEDGKVEGNERFRLSFLEDAANPFGWSFDPVIVTILDDDSAPVIGTVRLEARENRTAVGRLEASDADGGALTWRLAGGADAGLFELSGDGVLSLRTARTLAAPGDADGDGTYALEVEVSDGDNPVSGALAVELVEFKVPPDAPTNVVASQEVEAVELTWTEPLLDGGSAITGYEYRQRKKETEGYGPWQEIPGAAAGTEGHTVAGLDGGVRYVFELRAVNAQGKGAASRPASATPFAVLAPDAPGRLAATG